MPPEAQVTTGDSSPEKPALPEWALARAQDQGGQQWVATRLEGVLGRVKDNAVVRVARELWGYVTDPRIPTTHKVIALAGLVYLVNPFDAIPDPLPLAGYTDDAVVLFAVVRSVRQIVAALETSAKSVVSHAVAQAQEAVARRGVQHVCLTLWTVTLAAFVGLVYAAARGAVFGAAGGLGDPYVAACLATGSLGLVGNVLLARRVWERYVALRHEVREALAHALLAVIGWREIVMLLLPVLALVVIVGLKLGLSAGGQMR
jgi:uncharacterized membrane protein YkvA (DUF1232 family)